MSNIVVCLLFLVAVVLWNPQLPEDGGLFKFAMIVYVAAFLVALFEDVRARRQ